jgi:peptide-methionine (S)-S-oxide reductase
MISDGITAARDARRDVRYPEAIEIDFYPTRISYRDFLEFFFQIHDPPTLNRQGNDIGTSNRSEIFYVSEAQRDEALRTIDDVNASGLWLGRDVTKVSPADDFWQAEPEHQDYLERYPHGYTCHFRRPGLETAPPRRCGHLRPHCKTSSPPTPRGAQPD